MSEELEELKESLDTDDVGQKRYLMYRCFDLLLEKAYESKDEEMPDADEIVSRLKQFDGYMYKLAQDFLTSSSTHEKSEKLEKMFDRFD